MIRTQPSMTRAREDLKPPPEPEVEKTVNEPAPRRVASQAQTDHLPTNGAKGRQSRIVKKRPAVLAGAQWAAKWVNAGRPQVLVRTKRLLWWVAYNSYQAYAMVRVLVGGRIDEHDFAARMHACTDCQSLQIRLIHKQPFIKLYCGSCGCPQWQLSELRRKNRFRKWECPRNLHARLDDPAEWTAIIEAERLWAEQPVEDGPQLAAVDPLATPTAFEQPRRPCGGGSR